MLQAAFGRVNARAGEVRWVVPERDEKTLMHAMELIVGVTLRPSLSVFRTEDILLNPPGGTSSIYHRHGLNYNLSAVV